MNPQILTVVHVCEGANAGKTFRRFVPYEDARANTEKMPSFVPEIRKGFERLKMIYPDAVFPPVYFVTGRRNSGGTDSDIDSSNPEAESLASADSATEDESALVTMEPKEAQDIHSTGRKAIYVTNGKIAGEQG